MPRDTDPSPVGYRAPDGRVDAVLDGERLAVHVWRGGSEDALLLHGIFSDHRELGGLPARLADAGFSVRALDFRGCGASGGARAFLTLPRMLADVEAALAGDRPRLLLGHSLGAAIALHAVAAGLVEPERLVLATPPAWPAGGVVGASFGFAGLPGIRGMTIPLPRRYGLTVRARDALAWSRAQDFKSRAFPLATWHGLRDVRSLEAARSVRVPSLVLLAREDRLVPPAATRAVAARLSNARLVEVPGYHSVFLCEGTSAATREVLAFAGRGVTS